MCYHRSSARHPGRDQRGAALVVALLVFALCTALIVAMQGELTRVYQRGANIFLAEQGQAYLRGAEELAGLALQLDYDTDQGAQQARDDLEDIWAQPTTPYALDEGGWLMGSLEDLQGRLNLNALVGRAASRDGEQQLTAAQAQFIRLLQALGEPQVSEQEAIVITRGIGDWLDRDSEPAVDGAEDDYYYGQTPAYRAANRPMASVSELRAVANMTAEIYRALRPWVTVWPQAPATLNIHTAPAMVLRSLNADDNLSPLSEADAQALIATRENEGFADLDEFLAHPVFAGKQEKMAGVRDLLGQVSSYFLLTAEVEVADRKLHLYSVLQRRRRQVTAVVRGSGSL